MKKKTKKPLFDKRAPGGKMIVYGALLVMVGGVINAYLAWLLTTGVLFGAANTSDVIGYSISLCLQTALALLVAIDGINNRNRPSKGRSITINAICVFALAVVLLIQNGSSAGTGLIIAAVSMAGSVIMFIGGLKNRQAQPNAPKGKK